jgi:hypothetical protein
MSIRSRRPLPLLLLVGLAAPAVLPALAAAPADAAKAAKRCNQLKGKDLFPKNPGVRLVYGGGSVYDDGSTLITSEFFRACAGRFGKVHVVARNSNRSDLFTSDHPEVSAGPFFIMSSEYAYNDRLADTGFTLYDARTGKSRTLQLTPEPSAQDPESETYFDMESVVLDRNGTSVAVLVENEGGAPAGLPVGTSTYVAAYDRRGRRTVIDTGGSEIVPKSLKLRAGVATWAHGTEKRSHVVRQAACPSADLTATGASGGTTSSVAVGRLRVSGTGCRTAQGLAREVARLSLAGDPATTVQGYALAFTRPCAGCSPVTGVVATKGPRRVTFELRGGEG